MGLRELRKPALLSFGRFNTAMCVLLCATGRRVHTHCLLAGFLQKLHCPTVDQPASSATTFVTGSARCDALPRTSCLRLVPALCVQPPLHAIGEHRTGDHYQQGPGHGSVGLGEQRRCASQAAARSVQCEQPLCGPRCRPRSGPNICRSLVEHVARQRDDPGTCQLLPCSMVAPPDVPSYVQRLSVRYHTLADAMTRPD